MSSTKQGFRNLFMLDDGLPMVFHLPPGPTKKKLAPIIKRHGGEITSRNLKNVFCLADEKLWYSQILLTRGENFYWPSYIVDCVKCNALLDIKQYRCSRGRRLMRRISSEDVNSDSSDDFDFGNDVLGSNTVVTVPVIKKGRMKYTKREDMNIMRYLMEEKEYGRAKGIAVWNIMEKLQITTHSAQSMMTRFRKVILQQLDNYNIPDSWKTCLTGNLAYSGPSTSSYGAAGNVTDPEEEDSDSDTIVSGARSPRGHQSNPEPSQMDPQTLQFAARNTTAGEEELLDSFDEELLTMTDDDHRKSEKEQDTCTGVSAGDPNASPERGRSAAEPRESAKGRAEGATIPNRGRDRPDSDEASGAKLSHSNTKGVEGGGKECVENSEEEDLVLSYQTPEKRFCGGLRQDRRTLQRSPEKNRQKAASHTANSVTEEEHQSEGVPSTPDRGRFPRHGSSTRDSLTENSSPVYPMLTFMSNNKGQEAEAPSRKRKFKKMTALKALKALCKEFGLTMKEAQLFFRCNGGHVNATRYWIMTGRTLPGHSFWTPKEDRVLLACGPDHPTWQTLEEQRGLCPVLQRIQWLHS